MNNSTINMATIQLWLKQNLTHQDVEQSLVSNGYESELILEYLGEFNKQKRIKKQFIGFLLMGIGGFLGFIACVMTLLNIFPNLHDFFLFGITMVAVSMALYGLYLAFQ